MKDEAILEEIMQYDFPSIRDTNNKYVDHEGNSFDTFTEMCKYHDVKPDTAYKRLQRHFPMKVVLAKNFKEAMKEAYPMIEVEPVDHLGIRYKNVTTMAKAYNLSPETLKRRLAKGIPLKEALTTEGYARTYYKKDKPKPKDTRFDMTFRNTAVSISESDVNNKYCKNAKIPRTVGIIQKRTFAWCEELTSVVFEEAANIQAIGAYAFMNCRALRYITIEDTSIQVIEPYTFRNCTSLSIMRLPECLRQIKEKAFSGCEDLKTLYVPEDTFISSDAMDHESNIQVIRY